MSNIDTTSESHNTQEKLASELNISHSTLARGEIVAKNAPEEVKEMQFDSELEAMFWSWNNQKNRRNLSKYELGKQALIFKPLFEQQAKERELAGKKIDPPHNCAEGEKGKTRDKIAEIAGIKEQAKKNQVAGGELKGKLCQNSDKARLPRARSNSCKV